MTGLYWLTGTVICLALGGLVAVLLAAGLRGVVGVRPDEAEVVDRE